MKNFYCRLLALMALLTVYVTAGAFTVDGLNYSVSNGEATVTGATSKAITSVTIPAEVTYGGKTYPVNIVAYNAFNNYSSLRSVRFEDSESPIRSTSYIDKYGSTSYSSPFLNCPVEEYYFGRPQARFRTDNSVYEDYLQLASTAENVNLTYAGGTRRLLSCALNFRSMSPLQVKSITFGGNLLLSGSDAFKDCTNLETVTLLAGNYELSRSLFPQDFVIETLNLDSTDISKFYVEARHIKFADCWETVPEQFLSNKQSLESVTLPNTIRSIEREAFRDCRELRTINFPSSLRRIGHSAFAYCSKLIPPRFNEGLEYIEDSAFNSALGPAILVLPGSLKEIGYAAFVNNTNIEEVLFQPSVDNSPLECGSIFLSVGDFDKLFLNRRLNVFGNYFGKECNPKHVEFGDCWESIPNGFLGYLLSVESLALPHTLSYIGEEAFSKCINLQTINSQAMVPPVCGWNVFSTEIYPTAVLKVPGGCVRKYASADTWKNFLNIETDEPLKVSVKFDSEMGEVLLNGKKEGYIELDEGEPLNITIQPFRGYELTVLSVNGENMLGSLIEGSLHFDELQESLEVVVDFAPIMYSVSINAGITGGYIMINGESEFPTTVRYGERIEIRPLAYEGYVLDNLCINDEVVKLNSKGIYVIDSLESDINIDAKFEIIRLNAIAVYNASMGSVKLNGMSDNCLIDYNSSLEISVSPFEGHYIESVTVNGKKMDESLNNGTYIIQNVKEDVTIEVIFAMLTYEVSAIYDSDFGTVLINGEDSDAEVAWGTDAIVQIVPGYGYQIASVYVDDTDVTDKINSDGVYTVKSVHKDIVVSVKFEVKKVRVSIKGIEGGSLATVIDFNSELTYFPVADQYWMFHSATVGTEVIKTLDKNGGFKVGPLTEDTDIDVVFIKTTDVEKIFSTDKLTVSAKNRQIIISGAEDDAVAEVFNTDGICFYSGRDRLISLENGGAYIVTISGKSFKIMLY